jgi:hypothetical protein
VRPRILAFGIFAGMLATGLIGSTSVATPVTSPRDAPVRCYDQLVQDTGLSNVSDKYEAKYRVYDSRAADDFVLTTSCRIRSVDVIGTFFDGIGPAESEQVTFSVDDGGTPGAKIANQRVIGTYDVGGGSFHLMLHRPVVLAPGTYWLSVLANMIFDESGQWGWNSLDHQVGALPVWKNPLDGFETGCTTYQPLFSCVGGEAKDYLGLAFALNSSRR